MVEGKKEKEDLEKNRVRGKATICPEKHCQRHRYVRSGDWKRKRNQELGGEG